MRQRSDPDTAQVQTIGVPARLNRDVPFGESVRVQPARFIQELEVSIIEMDQRPP